MLGIPLCAQLHLCVICQDEWPQWVIILLIKQIVVMSLIKEGHGCPTPIDQVIRANPSLEQNIRKISGKWTARTKQDCSPWPSQGSLNIVQLIQLEGKILEYKMRDKSASRESKRLQELDVLQKFVELAKASMANADKGGIIKDLKQDNQINSDNPTSFPHEGVKLNGEFPQIPFSGTVDVPSELLPNDQILRQVHDVAEKLDQLTAHLRPQSALMTPASFSRIVKFDDSGTPHKRYEGPSKGSSDMTSPTGGILAGKSPIRRAPSGDDC